MPSGLPQALLKSRILSSGFSPSTPKGLLFLKSSGDDHKGLAGRDVKPPLVHSCGNASVVANPGAGGSWHERFCGILGSCIPGLPTASCSDGSRKEDASPIQQGWISSWDTTAAPSLLILLVAWISLPGRIPINIFLQNLHILPIKILGRSGFGACSGQDPISPLQSSGPPISA